MVKAVLGLAFWLLIASTCFSAAPPRKLPNWQELSPQQQSVLSPLSANWDQYTARRKKTMLDIANRYSGMSPEDQAKVQRRIQRWVKLSQEERGAIRESAKKIKQMPPEKKQTLAQEWDEYQKLPEEQKQKLTASAQSAKGKPKKPAARIAVQNPVETASPGRQP
jgi:hypothetical protein